MVSAKEKVLYFTRHAQAEHNVEEDYSIPDAPLTDLGRQQARDLYEETKDTFQKTAELLVTSALRRPMSTLVIGYASLRKRLEADGKPVVVLPQLQESNDVPCDIGLPREVLEQDPEFAGLDFSSLTPDWNKKEGFYAADPVSLHARGTWVRRWLRDRPEKEIVIVAHAAILRYITEGYDSHKPWANTEVRQFTFEAEDDEEAVVRFVRKVTQLGTADPGSSDI